MAFQPGKSGNPAGRPAIPPEVRELAKAKTVRAIEVLAEILDRADAPVREKIMAAEALLDRAWGKSTTMVDVVHRSGESLNELQAREMAEEFLKNAARATGLGAGESPRVHDSPAA